MIEHAKEEHDIERSLDGSEVTPFDLQARPQEARGHSKALTTLEFYPILASDKVPVLEVINRRHLGAAAFTPEREEPIPTADVQDGLPRQRTWDGAGPNVLASCAALPRCCYSIAQIDGMPPKWHAGDSPQLPLPKIRIRRCQEIPPQLDSLPPTLWCAVNQSSGNSGGLRPSLSLGEGLG